MSEVGVVLLFGFLAIGRTRRLGGSGRQHSSGVSGTVRTDGVVLTSMEVFALDKLILFLVFFVPGFISIKIYDLLVSGEKRDFSKSLPEAISYSCINFAFFSWLILLFCKSPVLRGNMFLFYPFLFVVLFAMPALWPLILLRARTSRLLRKHIIDPVKKPWDYVFGKREPYWIIIHLKDGRRIGGKFGEESFASSYSAEEQIYLEELWRLDENGKFTEKVERSKGAIVSARDIDVIEFFEF